MTSSDSPGSFTGTKFIALKCPLAVMKNFATLEWLLWKQGPIGVNLNDTVRLPNP